MTEKNEDQGNGVCAGCEKSFVDGQLALRLGDLSIYAEIVGVYQQRKIQTTFPIKVCCEFCFLRVIRNAIKSLFDNQATKFVFPSLFDSRQNQGHQGQV